jgi:hypothetical protein
MTQGPPEPRETEADFTGETSIALPQGPTVGERVTLGRELVRGGLAGALIVLLFLIDAAILILATLKIHPFDRDVLALLLTGLLNPVVALVGTVLGFYFGEKAGKAADK